MSMKPVAWLCELAQEDGTTRRQFVEQDPDGLRWNDTGEPSPYRTHPLFDQAAINAALAEERERIAVWLEGQGQPGYAHGIRFWD